MSQSYYFHPHGQRLADMRPLAPIALIVPSAPIACDALGNEGWTSTCTVRTMSAVISSDPRALERAWIRGSHDECIGRVRAWVHFAKSLHLSNVILTCVYWIVPALTSKSLRIFTHALNHPAYARYVNGREKIQVSVEGTRLRLRLLPSTLVDTY